VAACFSDPIPPGDTGAGESSTESESGADTGDTEDESETGPSGDECVPAPPSGWQGPIAVGVGTTINGLACESAWPQEQALGGVGDPGGAAACEPCSCGDASGATCPASAVFTRHVNDPSCTNIVSANFESTADCQFENVESNGNLLGIRPTPTPGSCPAQGGEIMNLPAAFAQFAKVCGLANEPQDCDGGLAVPEFEQPEDWATCVFQAGDLPACPPGSDYSMGPLVIADGFTDSRGCTSCECGDATEVQCGPYMTSVHTTVDCTGIANMIVHDDTCSMNSIGVQSWRLQGVPGVVSEGTCSPTATVEPTGGIEIDHVITVCCL
jgi:hypothetical protein